MKKIRSLLVITMLTILYYSFTYSHFVEAASNEKLNTAPDNIRFSIANSPKIISEQLDFGKVDEEYNYRVKTNNDIEGNTVTFSLEDGILPKGIFLEDDGTVKGTPLEVGVFKFTLRMKNSSSSFVDDVKDFSISILEKDAIFYSEKFKETEEKNDTNYIKTSSLPDAVKYVIYNNKINTYILDSETSLEWMSGKLPEGMFFRKNGEVYGIPRETGKFFFTVRIENSNIKKKISITVLDSNEENILPQVDKGYEIIEERTTLPKEINLDSLEDEGYIITSNGSFDEFRELYFNGNVLEKEKDYTVKEGSTEATLKRQVVKASILSNNIISFAYQKKNGEIRKTSYLFKAINNKSIEDTKKEVVPSKKETKTIKNKYGKTKKTTKVKPKKTVQIKAKVIKKEKKAKKQNLNYDKAKLTYHIIKKGDTLWELSIKKYGTGVKWVRIMKANDNLIPRKLQIGRKIILP